MVNVFGSRPNSVVAKQTVTFVNAGITALNTAVIYLVDNPLKSYVPGRMINGITGFEKGKGYYIVALQDMDLQSWVMAPVVTASAGVPLIVFTGESNSGGYALNSEATTEELAPRPAVQILNNTSLVFEALDIGTNNLIGHTGLSNGTTHGWELMLANRVEAGTFIPSPCYLVKTGQGASTIAQWDVGDASGYWNTFQTRVDEAIDLLTTLTGSAPSIYLFYSQGINDAIAGTSTATWKTKTLAHWDKIRAKYGQVPIVATKFMSNYSAYNTAIDEVVAQRQDAYAVVTSDATLRDANHWDYAGMKLVSGRMQDVFLQNYAI